MIDLGWEPELTRKYGDGLFCDACFGMANWFLVHDGYKLCYMCCDVAPKFSYDAKFG